MINNKRVLAYIPARSGSKSIIDKNIVEVCGKPLIAYTIEVAKKSKYIDKIIVSTDSPKYAEIAKKWGAEVPFLRPAELAADNSVEMDACQHLIKWVEANLDEMFDIIVKLQPTSPLRISEDIDKAIEKIIEKDADTIITVNEAPTHPFWMNTLPEDESMAKFIEPAISKKNRQELPKYYQLNGSVLVGKWHFISKFNTWYGKNVAGSKFGQPYLLLIL